MEELLPYSQETLRYTISDLKKNKEIYNIFLEDFKMSCLTREFLSKTFDFFRIFE